MRNNKDHIKSLEIVFNQFLDKFKTNKYILDDFKIGDNLDIDGNRLFIVNFHNKTKPKVKIKRRTKK